MPVVRLLLPLCAVLALLAQPPMAWASSGIVGDTHCCCPDPATCECHDHEGDAHHDAKMKRCGSDPVKLVAPLLLVAVPAPARPALEPPRTIVAPAFVVPILPAGRPERPEKPPS